MYMIFCRNPVEPILNQRAQHIIIGFLLKLNVAAGGSGIFTKNPRSSRLRVFKPTQNVTITI